MGKKTKSIFLVLFLIIALVVIYVTFFNNNQEAKQVKDVKTFTESPISDEELSQLDTETQKVAKEYDYNETFDSFDSLNKEKQEDDSYIVPKYTEKKLYLVIVSKKTDGTVFAIFSDEQ